MLDPDGKEIESSPPLTQTHITVGIEIASLKADQAVLERFFSVETSMENSPPPNLPATFESVAAEAPIPLVPKPRVTRSDKANLDRPYDPHVSY
jgi:hypothetical protein